MWCRNVRSQLSAYADGELTPAAAQRVEEHLVGCEGCAREHAELQRLVNLTGCIPMEEVPASLHDRIMTRLAYAHAPAAPVRRPASRSALPPSTWAWAAFTTAAFAVACGIAQQRPGQSTRGLRPFPAVEAAPKSQPSTAPAVAEHTTPAAPAPAAPSGAVASAPAPGDQPVLVVAPAAPALDTMPKEMTVAGTAVEPREIEERALSLPAKPLAEQPQPAVVATSGKPAMEARASEPTAPVPSMMAKEPLMAMPGEPIVNSTGPLGQSDPIAMMEKEPTRMAGMAIEVETPGEEDEGLRTFRMFIQENSKMVPQPPTLSPGRERKKSL